MTYIKNIWKDEDIITDVKMNKIEKGIKDSHDRLDLVNTELEAKANLNSIFNMANMGQDIKEAMTGGSVAVVEGESVSYNNLSSDMKKSFGVLDTIDLIWENGYTNANNIFQNVLAQQHANVQVSSGDMFELTIQTGYTIVPIVLAYKDNELIEVINSSTDYNNFIYTVPQSCNMLVIQRSYLPSNGFNKVGVVKKYNLSNVKINTLEKEVIKKGNMSYEYLSSDIKNVLKKYEVIQLLTWEKGYYRSDGTFQASNDQYNTIFEVCAGDEFKITIQTGYTIVPIVLAYKDNELIEVINSSTDYIEYLYVVPQNCNKLLIQRSYNPSNGFNNIGKIEKTVCTKVNIEELNSLLYNPNHNKKWCAIGDSLTATWFDVYVSYVSKNLGMEFFNHGVGGSCLAINTHTDIPNKSFVERVLGLSGNDAINDFGDLCTIFGGTNDALKSSIIGEIDSSDNNTVFGALNNIIEHILSISPNTKIVLITPYNMNNSILPYRDAICNIGLKYGLKIVDLYSISQISSFNKATFLRDGVHPNQKGVDMLRPIILNELKNIALIHETDSMPN